MLEELREYAQTDVEKECLEAYIKAGGSSDKAAKRREVYMV
jgi:hypothetical protein